MHFCSGVDSGIADILIAVVDGLKGFPEAITAVFPQTIVQTCIVHLIRHSLEFVSWKDRKPVMPALRAIYRAKDAEAGRTALDDFRRRPLGPALSRHRPELAAQLGARHSLLRLPRRRPPHRLHHQRHRSAELQTAARRSDQGTLPQ